MAEKWMTVQRVMAELLERWGASPNDATVRRWCQRGLLPGATLTHDGWRIPRSGYDAFLRSRTRGGTCT